MDVEEVPPAIDQEVVARADGVAPKLSPVASAAFEEAQSGVTVACFEKWGALENEELHTEYIKRLPHTRKKVAEALNSGKFDTGLCTVLLTNLVIAILETDATADEDTEVPHWIEIANVVLLVVYVVEILLRLYIYRRLYLRSYWNLMDVGVVSMDLVLHLLRGVIGNLPNLSVLRIVRLIRLARAFRIIALFPELHTMMTGLAGTVKTVVWGICLLAGFIAFFALVAVQLIHPINKTIVYDSCERCPRAYESVWESYLTFMQQVVAGDSWGTVTLDVIEESPATMMFFLLVLVTINLLVINLILAVVVEKATEAHAEENREVVRQQALEKEHQMRKAQAELVKLCYHMDEDKSGNLSLDELLHGYDNDEYFANLLKSMDISRDDVRIVFNILDQDSSGDIDYVEFVDQLHRLKCQDEHTLLIFIMHYVKELQALLANDGKVKRKDSKRMTTNTSNESALATALPAVAQQEALESRSVAEQRSLELQQLTAMVEDAHRLFGSQSELLASISASFERLSRSTPQEFMARAQLKKVPQTGGDTSPTTPPESTQHDI
eukprot:CAMPEP_0176134360 /NCGR_PEP_ID=MMETSP0120_2-20121206/68136_1 /TAXON_ID=160619 /ORGANISM="Kryptoperidinium foliaceum, Strain CCMP 1326" /LENGTH=553 /DNA_ID=CAMNT_0017470005 /DNA_START=110 /DNA_END=1771 /DNA_ORIENTATION=-